MKEQLVSFETAKLAKEKGFIELGVDIAYKNGEIIKYKMLYDLVYLAPTQSLLQKWLREVHNIDVVIYPERYANGINYLVQAQKWDLTSNIDKNTNFVIEASYWFNDNGEYPTYEEALEKGLQEALKLIP